MGCVHRSLRDNNLQIFANWFLSILKTCSIVHLPIMTDIDASMFCEYVHRTMFPIRWIQRKVLCELLGIVLSYFEKTFLHFLLYFYDTKCLFVPVSTNMLHKRAKHNWYLKYSNVCTYARTLKDPFKTISQETSVNVNITHCNEQIILWGVRSQIVSFQSFLKLLWMKLKKKVL